jgi:hypothetical protein
MCCHLLFLIFSFLEVTVIEPDDLDLLILLECLSLYLFCCLGVQEALIWVQEKGPLLVYLVAHPVGNTVANGK